MKTFVKINQLKKWTFETNEFLKIMYSISSFFFNDRMQKSAKMQIFLIKICIK